MLHDKGVFSRVLMCISCLGCRDDPTACVFRKSSTDGLRAVTCPRAACCHMVPRALSHVSPRSVTCSLVVCHMTAATPKHNLLLSRCSSSCAAGEEGHAITRASMFGLSFFQGRVQMPIFALRLALVLRRGRFSFRRAIAVQ